MNQFGPLLFGFIFLCIMVLTARPAYESLQLSRWMKVEGEVQRVYVETTTEGSKVTYRANMDYMYSYMGIPYMQTRACGEQTSSRRTAERDLASHTAGQAIDVWVYTWRPTHCKLVPGIDPAYPGIFCVSLLLFAFMLLIYLHST